MFEFYFRNGHQVNVKLFREIRRGNQEAVQNEFPKLLKMLTDLRKPFAAS